MSPDEILSKLTDILRDTLGDRSVDLKMETVRADVANWDSFNYIVFMVAVESTFKIKFHASDIESFSNVGAVVQKIIELEAA
jgi:acyl carrier protein